MMLNEMVELTEPYGECQVMKRLFRNLLKTVCVPCLFFSAFHEAHAEWKPGRHMAESMATNLALGTSIEQKTDYGFCDTCYLGAFIQPGDDSFITMHMEAGRGYLFAGAVEDGNDLDIVIEDQSGNKVAKDTRADNIPMVEFTPSRSGRYTIRLKLYEARHAEFCGMVLMRKGGWRLPMKNLGTATGMVLANCQQVSRITPAKFMQERGEWAIVGVVLREGEKSTFSKMHLGSGRRVIVTGADSQSRDTDLAAYLEGSSRVELTSDTERDNQPFLQLTASRSNQYAIETSNAESNGPSVVMTALLDID